MFSELAQRDGQQYKLMLWRKRAEGALQWRKKEFTYVYRYRHRPTDAEFTALIAALDARQETLYPAESNHLLDLSQLPPQTVIAPVIRSAQGEAVGCGAIVLSEEGFGEMKRVYIDPAAPRTAAGRKAAGGPERSASA